MGNSMALGGLKQALRPFAPYLRRPATGPSWLRSFSLLKRRGFQAKTVFDIGVAYGTYDLYRAFPDAFYYLIDPTRESLVHMRKLSQQLRCEVLNVALGDRDGEIDMEIRADILGSTFFEDYGAVDVLRKERVPMCRFDALIGEFERPALCKIDVQGAEMLVLKGMTGRMSDLDAVLLETSTISTLKGGPEVYDVMSFMKDQGFVIFDVLGITRRPLDGAVAQLDLLFLPEDSPLRSDRRWSARG